MNFIIKFIRSFLPICIIGLLLVTHFLPVKIAFASTNSKIVYSDNTQNIQTLNPDGTGVTVIGHGSDPQISPNESKIVYSYLTPRAHEATDIYTMNIDGSNIQDITANQPAGAYAFPSWSPDGTRIVFAYNNEIYVMNADGSNATDLHVAGFYTTWSPENSKIAFENSNASGTIELFTMNSDGSDITDLGISYIYSLPSWSHDGTKIAYWYFNYSTNPVTSSINVVNADGTGNTSLFKPYEVAGVYSIGWSPDDSTLAFSGGVQYTQNENTTSGLYTMPISGDPPTRIYFDGNLNDAYDSWVTWGNLNLQTNQAPQINALSNAILVEGTTFSQNDSFTDPDSTSWTATIDYGDGSGAQPLPLARMNFTLSHIYEVPGTYTVTVTIIDNQGGTATATATITVTNVAPTVGTISLSPTVPLNASVNTSASFTDPGTQDTHTAQWVWGDTMVTQGMVTEAGGAGSVTGSHTYASLGAHTITLTVTDNGGLSGTSQIVVAVIPAKGLAGVNLTGLNYSGANLSSQNLSGSNMQNTTFNNTNLQNAIFTGVNAQNSSLQQANLTGAKLAGANFSGANLQGAILSNATLTGTNLRNTNLTNINLSGANLKGANLQGARVAGIIWSNTICPDNTNSNNDGGTCTGHGGGL